MESLDIREKKEGEVEGANEEVLEYYLNRSDT